MSSLIVNVILGFWLVLFGAMALYPLFVGGQKSSHVTKPKEDVVISIRPIAPGRPRAIQPSPVDLPAHDHDSTPHAA